MKVTFEYLSRFVLFDHVVGHNNHAVINKNVHLYKECFGHYVQIPFF